MNGLFGNNFSMFLPALLFGKGFGGCGQDTNPCCNGGCENGMNNILPILLLLCLCGSGGCSSECR